MSKNLDEVMSKKEGKHVMSYIPNMITIANFVCGLRYSRCFRSRYV